MRRIAYLAAAGWFLLMVAATAGAYTVGNPVEATGSGKLAVSAEYEYQEHQLPDVSDIESTRYLVKAGIGLTSWLDLFAKGGAAHLEIPLEGDRFIGEDKFAWGAGARATLWRLPRWHLEIFSSGQILSFHTNGRIDQEITTSPEVWTRRLDTKYVWWEYGGALGLKVRRGVLSPYLGVDVSYVEGEKITRQYNLFSYGSVYAGQSSAEFSSEDVVFSGFGGLDILLPLRYRLSLELRGKSRDQISFTIGMSQRSP
jgi:hypothetical protein